MDACCAKFHVHAFVLHCMQRKRLVSSKVGAGRYWGVGRGGTWKLKSYRIAFMCKCTGVDASSYAAGHYAAYTIIFKLNTCRLRGRYLLHLAHTSMRAVLCAMLCTP